MNPRLKQLNFCAESHKKKAELRTTKRNITKRQSEIQNIFYINSASNSNFRRNSRILTEQCHILVSVYAFAMPIPSIRLPF